MQVWSKILFACGVVAMVCPAMASAPIAPVSHAPDFAMLDYKGRHHQLSRAQAKAVVLFFTANGCPIARQSISRLKSLEREFRSQGIAFWMVNSNLADDRESIRREAGEFFIDPIPVLLDETQGVAAVLGVRRTGTAICIDTSNRRIVYRGAVDDQFSEGARKPEASEHYLATALTHFLAGEAVSVGTTRARGCLISFVDRKPVSYATEVAPILRQKCVTCHSPGNIGPFSMSGYRKVRGMSDMIQEVILARRMPPWDADRQHGKFHNDFSLDEKEARLILAWIEQGAERGEGADPLDAEAPPAAEWTLGEPDSIISLPEVQEIPANGVLDYRYIRVAAPFDRDVWVGGVVAKPDNNRVVHHIIVRVKEPGKETDHADDAFLIGWAPGSPEMFFPEGTGKLIPKGAELEFEMHYTTSGRPEKDQSRIGLYLLKKKPRMVLKTHAALDTRIQIPPREPNAITFATYAFRRDGYLFDLSPHMHLRGSWFRYEALYPDGEREVLLSVPQYDFNWQHTYRLAEPKRMPAGTYILCSGGFDNSERNPHNPDPSKQITWGEQSWDEMFIGFMGVAQIPPGELSRN